MKRIPLYDETAPIACSLAPEDVPERLATIERLRTEHVGLDRTEHGLLLHFAPEPGLEAELRAFALDEKRCCSFWGFAVDASAADDLTLAWEAPPSAAALIDELESFFTGDAPAEILAGLL